MYGIFFAIPVVFVKFCKLVKSANLKSTFVKFAPDTSAPCKSAPVKIVPEKSVFTSVAPDRSVFVKSIPDKSISVKFNDKSVLIFDRNASIFELTSFAEISFIFVSKSVPLRSCLNFLNDNSFNPLKIALSMAVGVLFPPEISSIFALSKITFSVAVKTFANVKVSFVVFNEE